MDEWSLLWVLALFQSFPTISSCYFHEKSRILLKPSKANPLSDFGFAMTYQNSTPARLVIGAPRNDLMGKVYQCSIENILDNDTLCDMVNLDVESAAKYRRDINPNQNFYLGASIVATSDYFLTCAPLWTDTVSKPRKTIEWDVCGMCFSYNGSTSRYIGSLEQYMKGAGFNGFSSLYVGGVGWTNLIDEINGMLLIAKSSAHGDIKYVKSSNPTGWTTSMTWKYKRDKYKDATTYLGKQTNLGYSLAAGNFFDNSTVYAFSMQPYVMKGMVAFIEYINDKVLRIMEKTKGNVYTVSSGDVGSMFGSSLCATDLNMDGYSELFVGAPGHFNDEMFEYGAVHIYIGGDKKTFTDISNMRSIIGVKEGARFGTTIASSDIDGDGLPEIFVSAPYEDSGLGAVYILSGYEVNKTLLSFSSYKNVQLSELKFTQRLQDNNHKTFGFSLLVVSDIDNNGCDELAVGSPGTAGVVLFRCLPAIGFSLTTQLIGDHQKIREQENFAIRVCVHIKLNTKLKNVTTVLVVTNNIKGDGASIPSPTFLVDLSEGKQEYCNNVSVEINNNDPGDYQFNAHVELDSNYNKTLELKEFSNTWAVLRSHIKKDQTLEICLHCEGDCSAKLNMTITRSGSKEYLLGSTETENVTITFRNDGHNSYQACAVVRVSGAQVSRLGCAGTGGEYTCGLPKPFRRNKEHSINIVLNMSNPLSNVEQFDVKVKLYENCNQPNFTEEYISVPYRLSTNNIFVEELNHYRNITDQEIMELSSDTIDDGHEFLINNNGSVTWTNVYAVVTVEKKSYIVSYEVPSIESEECYQMEDNKIISFNCTFTLAPKTIKKIFATMKIAKKDLDKNLINGKLITSTHLSLYLPPTIEVISKEARLEITFRKELSVKNDKKLIILIAAIVAMLLMACVIFMLYKLNFFKRKQKQKLNVLRESIRRNIINKSTPDIDGKETTDKEQEDTASMEIEVIEDSPFQDIPIPIEVDDGVVLIEERAQVHC